MNSNLCIYHGNCADGFSAAWVIWSKFRDTFDYCNGVYGNEPPYDYIKDGDVYIVDFSYKRPVMEKIVEMANSVTIIDHHQSAEEDIAPLIDEGLVKGIFDMTKSGSMLTWEWFYPDLQPPQLLRHVQDRDLWKFELEGTREIQSCLFSYPYEFEIWDGLMNGRIEDLRADGITLDRKHLKDIKEICEVVKQRMTIEGYNIPVFNLPYTMGSDACSQHVKDEPFAAYYYDVADGRVFGLRSDKENGVDVAKIAQKFGGGGHKNASGFKVDFDTFRD